MTAVSQSNESYSLLVMIAFFSTLFLTLIICAIVGAIIISNHKKLRLKQEVETQEEYDLNLYEFIDSDLDESDDGEYDKINYDQLNVGGNETAEYLQIIE
jgi:hypothetical protein